MTDADQMKNFITLLEDYAAREEDAPMVEDIPAAPEPNRMELLEAELQDLVFRLRNYQESEPGDYGLGIETGMTKASDMIENVLKRVMDK